MNNIIIDITVNCLNKCKYTAYLLRYLRKCMALNKGNKAMHARDIDLMDPTTWEFSGFSQNGEDGILDVLRSQLLQLNYKCVEIGVEDGIQSNTAWMITADKYDGVMVDGNPTFANHAKIITPKSLYMFVTRENVQKLKTIVACDNPDVFSLDIDGNDYYIAKAIFEEGFRPKIFVVEYNSVFGLDLSVTIEYQKYFVYTKAHQTHLYYGVSISGWKKFFEMYGYRFITVDTNGVNAFFADINCFDIDFLDNIGGINFAENIHQYNKFSMTSDKQFKFIRDMKLVDI